MNNSELQKLVRVRRKKKWPLVLIIEDNLIQQDVYRLAQNMVRMIPCIVSSCQQGIEAAEVLSFDLIILNAQLPHECGIDCVRELKELDRKRGTRTPTIAVTAHAMPGDREKCLTAGMDDYLSKPFELAELKKKISTWAA